MDTVTEAAMAITLAREGGIGVIHRNMTAERSLQEVTFVKQAEELIERDVLYVESTATVSDAERIMQQYSIGGVPVIEKGKIIGIVSRRDVRAIVQKRGDEKITAIMTKTDCCRREHHVRKSARDHVHEQGRAPSGG
jgi:IMP dehydrogenase